MEGHAAHQHGPTSKHKHPKIVCWVKLEGGRLKLCSIGQDPDELDDKAEGELSNEQEVGDEAPYLGKSSTKQGLGGVYQVLGFPRLMIGRATKAPARQFEHSRLRCSAAQNTFQRTWVCLEHLHSYA